MAIERRGKEQRLRLASGRELRVHFRMTGDWVVPAPGERLPRTVRAVIGFDDGGRLALDDPRALSVLSLCAPGGPGDDLGLEATDPALTAGHLMERLTRRRVPIKVALLDQRVVAGVGNIYASEALWRARIDPRIPANRLTAEPLSRLVRAIRATMAAAIRRSARYHGGDPATNEGRFSVYDREGERCTRCQGRIRRIVQGQRSSYYCARCQRADC